MKILVFKVGAMGDALMSTPMIRQLRRNFPDATIDYLIGNASSQVLEGNSNINEIMKFDEKIFFKKNITGITLLAAKIRKRKYDVILVLDKHWFFNFTSYLFGIKRRIGFDRLGKEGKFLTDKVYYGNDKHEIFYYLDLINAMKCRVDYHDWKMEIFPGKEDFAFAGRALKKISRKNIIGIAPGGGKNAGEKTEMRSYPVEKYAELANMMLKKNRNNFIILFGGPGDKSKEDFIVNYLDDKSRKRLISFIGKTSIKQTAAIAKKCRYFVCNDAGTMHIAACVNKNIISIFGPTKPSRKAPLWKESMSLWKDSKIYDENYELFGKIGIGAKFFSKITPEEIIKFIK